MYRCQVCLARTEDIDVPNCDPANHDFIPQEIVTVHHSHLVSGKGRVLLCTDEPARPGVASVGGNYGITCIRCKTKLKAILFPEVAAPPKRKRKASLPENLPETGNTDKISGDQPPAPYDNS